LSSAAKTADEKMINRTKKKRCHKRIKILRNYEANDNTKRFKKGRIKNKKAS
jgi:hypothetical protein